MYMPYTQPAPQPPKPPKEKPLPDAYDVVKGFLGSIKGIRVTGTVFISITLSVIGLLILYTIGGVLGLIPGAYVPNYGSRIMDMDNFSELLGFISYYVIQVAFVSFVFIALPYATVNMCEKATVTNALVKAKYSPKRTLRRVRSIHEEFSDLHLMYALGIQAGNKAKTFAILHEVFAILQCILSFFFIVILATFFYVQTPLLTVLIILNIAIQPLIINSILKNIFKDALWRNVVAYLKDRAKREENYEED